MIALTALLLAAAPAVGAFVNLASPLCTEIMGIAGFDWLVLDLEHGAGDEALLASQLQALAAADVAMLVRTEGIDLPRFIASEATRAGQSRQRLPQSQNEGIRGYLR